MATECERKFLLKDPSIISGLQGKLITQGYLAINERVVMRVRIKGDEAFITIKEAKSGLSRLEFDYVVPIPEAQEMIDKFALPPVIRKFRYEIPAGEHVWEIDQFFGENEGLMIAEIELAHEEEPFEKPGWVGEEVTQDERYYNAALVTNPYKSWE